MEGSDATLWSKGRADQALAQVITKLSKERTKCTDTGRETYG